MSSSRCCNDSTDNNPDLRLYLYVIQPANNLGDKLINLLLVLLCSLIVYLMGVIALPTQPTESSSDYQFTKNHD